MGYTVKKLEAVGPTEWNSLMGKDYVLFVGSAVSMWGDHGMPPGQSITNAVISDLMGEIPPERQDRRDIIRKWIGNVPFEVILGKCNDQNALREWIYEMCRNTKPNEMHKYIVQYALKSETKFIITTNYDTCLEEYMEEAGINYRVIWNEADVPEITEDAVIVYKIHGSARKEHIFSLVFSDEQEARLPAEKKRVMNKILHGRNLLMIGYSGLDFEICPEILATEPKNIVWNFLSPNDIKKSIGLVGYIGRTNRKNGSDTIALWGSMDAMVSKFWSMGNLKLRCKDLKVPAINIVPGIKKLWCSRVLQAMGIGGVAIELMNSIDYAGIKAHVSEYLFYKYYARAYFYKSEFLTSYDYHKKCENGVILSKKDIISNKIAIGNICQDIALAGVVYPDFATCDPREWISRSETYLNEAYLLIGGDLTGVSDRDRQLVEGRYLLAKVRLFKYYDWLAIYSMGKADALYKFSISDRKFAEYQSYARTALEKAVQLFEEAGDYTDRANCFLFAAQFKVHLHQSDTSLEISGTGYSHLGCKVGEMLFFRTQLRQKYLEKANHAISKEEKEKLDEYILETGILDMGVQHRQFKDVRDQIEELAKNIA